MPALPTKSFILCVHAHQPVGNFEWVFEEAYEKSYRPFFEVLEKHPGILMNCHFSGSLLDWLMEHKPEFIEKLQKMHLRGQLEFIGGGYYEPIYGMLSKKDLAGQILLMQERQRALFGKTPLGSWLTERVWDPELAKTLRSLGIEFTILDDLHLENAGVKAPVTGYYETGEGKDSIRLFASMKDLRYLMPFKPALDTVQFLGSSAAQPEDCFVFGDDIEKFGLWPGTYEWVYGQGWLEQLFSLLEKSEQIKLYTFSQFLSAFRPKSKVSVPHSSYIEMMEWSDGNYYNFFKKYPESAYMRDRMQHLSDRVAKVSPKPKDKNIWEKVKQLLYKAQCNCAYWHGVFGGLYLHHLRSAIFENIIQAETTLTKEAKRFGLPAPKKIESIKLRSGNRFRVLQKNMVSFFNPFYGGALEELDYLPLSVNLMCNLGRHKEKYHQSLIKKEGTSGSSTKEEPLSIHDILGSKEKDLKDHLHYDRYRRLSFLDHFFEAPLELDDFMKCLYKEKWDAANKPYKAKKTLKGLELSRKAGIEITKLVTPRSDNVLRVQYTLKNTTARLLETVLGIEFNFSIGDNFAMKGVTSLPVRDWVLKDDWRNIAIKLRMSQPFSFLAAPIETVSGSEAGLEKTYQELGVLLQKKVGLKPKGTESFWIELETEAF